MGCTNPRQENPKLRFRPLGTACATMAMEVGKQSAMAMPWKARNIINSIPFLASPQAMIKQPVTKHPIRFMVRFPMTSATEPARSRQDPLVNLWGAGLEHA